MYQLQCLNFYSEFTEEAKVEILKGKGLFLWYHFYTEVMFSDTFWAVLRKSNVWILSPHWICASLYILPRLRAQDDTVSSSDSAHVMLWTDTVRSFHRLCGSAVAKGFRIRNYTLSSVQQKLQSLQESHFSLQWDFSLSWVVQVSDLGWSWKMLENRV